MKQQVDDRMMKWFLMVNCKVKKKPLVSLWGQDDSKRERERKKTFVSKIFWHCPITTSLGLRSLFLWPYGTNTYKDTKPLLSAFLKYWPVKVLGGMCSSVWGPWFPPTLHTVWIHVPLYLFTQGKGEGGIDEPVRRLGGRYFKRGVEKTNMTDCPVSPVYKLY
jgi:hypothetical protein